MLTQQPSHLPSAKTKPWTRLTPQYKHSVQCVRTLVPHHPNSLEPLHVKTMLKSVTLGSLSCSSLVTPLSVVPYMGRLSRSSGCSLPPPLPCGNSGDYSGACGANWQKESITHCASTLGCGVWFLPPKPQQAFLKDTAEEKNSSWPLATRKAGLCDKQNKVNSYRLCAAFHPNCLH